jgi:alanine racemase
MQMFRQTWAEVDLDAIHHNISSFVRWTAPRQEVLAAVKANGYGHGAVPVAKEALAAGAKWLGVALLEEAFELREAEIEAPILIMGYMAPEHVRHAQEKRISITVTDADHLRAVCGQVDPELPALNFHAKIDTGMGRLGMSSNEELLRMVTLFQELPLTHRKALCWEGAYTHLATADEEEETYYKEQLNLLGSYMNTLQAAGIEVPYIHAANSAGPLRRFRRPATQLVRVGISTYGLAPSAHMKKHLPFELVPALSLHSRLSFVKQTRAGRGISYGCTYITAEGDWIGTIPIGYGDGFSRPLSNCAHVLVQGRRLPLVGNICMDQTMVKLDRYYPRGEKVTLIGKQGQDSVTADELADLLGTINYEITCQITSRVPRLYTRSGKPVQN